MPARRRALIALSLILGGCETPSRDTGPDPSITPARIEAAKQSCFACLGDSIRQLDDRISPANVVGEQVHGMCAAQCRELFSLQARSQSRDPDYLRGAVSEIAEACPSIATSAVLTSRTKRQQGK